MRVPTEVLIWKSYDTLRKKCTNISNKTNTKSTVNKNELTDIKFQTEN